MLPKTGSYIGVILLFFLTACSFQSKQIEKPNVLFIAVDDLNDWVGALGGHPQALTPNIDKLVNKGVLFTNAHCSQAVCTASRNSMLSGIHPAKSGWYASTTSMGKNYDRVMEDNMMLPEYFRANGYKTMTVGKIWHSGESDFKDKTDQYWDVVAPHFWRGMENHIKENGYGYRGYMFYPFPKNGGQLVELFGKDTIVNHFMKVNRFYSLCGGPVDEQDIPERGMIDEPDMNWPYPVLSVWRYKNYAVRSKDWRYIRYRNGEEELYDHNSDPGEHKNLASMVEYESVIGELKKWLPESEALPAGIEEWEGDSYDQRVNTWEQTEVPKWLN